MSISVQESDLLTIADVVIPENHEHPSQGGSVFVVDGKANIERIIIRSILSSLNYSITRERVYEYTTVRGIAFHTNYPWKRFKELQDSVNHVPRWLKEG